MKKIKKLTIVLAIVLVCLVSFVGVYVQKQNRMENIIREYELGMNLSGYREVRFKLTEAQDVTREKVIETKKILEERIKELGVKDYLLRVNEGTGEIVLELEEDSYTDKIASNIYQVGDFNIVDSEDDKNVLLNKNDLKIASVKYNTTEQGTIVYLNLEFTEEGAKKLEDISTNAYKTLEETKDTTSETKEDTEKVKQPKITIKIDENEMVTTSFDEPVKMGALQISLSAASTDTETIQTAIDSGLTISTILNNGPLPMKYEVRANQYIYSEITEETLLLFSVAIALLVIAGISILVVKYKMSALFAGISYIGFVSIYLLIIRYANVTITLEGIAGILLILLINYLLIQKMLSKADIVEAYKEMFTQLIPVIAVVIVFSFINWTNIASFGMTMFWGLLSTVPYNLAVTNTLIKKEDK